MGHRVWADRFESGQLSNTDMFQTIKLGDNKIVIAIRTWLVIYNSPTFTNLKMHIYSNEVVSTDNTPRVLLATSTNSFNLSDITTYANAKREVYFKFNFVPFKDQDLYNLVMSADGYVYSESSHLAWVKGWPDPVYKTSFTPTFENLLIAPYEAYAIGGDY